MVINNTQSTSVSVEGTGEEQIDVLRYKFEANDILLGEGGVSVAELRPVLVTESPGEDRSTFLKSMAPPSSNSSPELGGLSNEESMKEYTDLKFSLLLYDFILFSTGSSILLTLDERHAYSFLLGGIVGFSYLLLLQRSVDGLSAGEELENFAQGFGKFIGPLFSLALALIASVVALKYATGGSSMMLTPTDLFIGTAGFLTCKIAVVLAAFKPIKRSLKEEN